MTSAGVVHVARPPRAVSMCRRRQRGRAPRPCRPGQGVLGEDDPVAAQHVVGVELRRQDQVDLGQVAERLGRVLLLPVEDQQDLAGEAERLEGAAGVAWSWAPGSPSARRRRPCPRRPGRRGPSAGRRHHLLGRALGVAAGLGPDGHATATPVRRPGGALAGPAGALLAPRLAPATADLGPGEGAVVAGADAGQLGGDHLVHHRDVRRDAEDVVVELGGAHGAAGRVADVDGTPWSALPVGRRCDRVADQDEPAPGPGNGALERG